MLADAAVSSANFWIMAVSAISAAVALVIGYTTARSIQKPLQKINHELAYMARGDMTRRINYPTRCEFGRFLVQLTFWRTKPVSCCHKSTPVTPSGE